MSNIKQILIVTIALIAGLGLGYFLFSGSTESHSHPAIPSSPSDEEWTCSMHPQIRSQEAGLCPICEMDLIPASNSNSDNPLVLEMTKSAVQLANIQTTLIGSESVGNSKTLALSGKIQADERLAFSQVSHAAGRIEQLFVTFTGEKIKKGQKIAVLYSPDLINAQREFLEARKLRSINPALLDAARKKLSYWMIPHHEIMALEESGKIQERLTLHAENDGVVTAKRIDVGDHVHEGQILFDLVDLNKLWVIFDAYEEDLPYIQLGNTIDFQTPAIPGKSFKTRVNFIDPVINPQTRVTSIRAEVQNFSGKLKPEMFVKGILQVGATNTTALMVPKSAVLWTGKRSVVYVKVPDTEIPSYEYREVEIGENLGDQYTILSGLNAGDEVVTNGSFTIDAAAQLNNQQSMMNQLVNLKEEVIENPNYLKETPKAFKGQMDQLVLAYLDLKDALVETSATIAQEKADILSNALTQLDANLLEGEAKAFWEEKSKSLGKHINQVKALDDVEKQRQQFSFLSELMIELVLALGTSEQDLFVQYCPMALDDKGANWLSKEEQILNPYFGDKMLKCGIVEEELQGAISLGLN